MVTFVERITSKSGTGVFSRMGSPPAAISLVMSPSWPQVQRAKALKSETLSLDSSGEVLLMTTMDPSKVRHDHPSHWSSPVLIQLPVDQSMSENLSRM